MIELAINGRSPKTLDLLVTAAGRWLLYAKQNGAARVSKRARGAVQEQH